VDLNAIGDLFGIGSGSGGAGGITAHEKKLKAD
jgi:hypothetical protein